MSDLTEEEAVLHLKRALGELDANDAVPRALAPVALPPPKAKVQKLVASSDVKSKMAPMVGPSAAPSGGVSMPVKQPTWAEIRQQQESEAQQQQMQKAIQAQQKSALDWQKKAQEMPPQMEPPNFGRPPGLAGMAQALKSAAPPLPSGPGGFPGMPPLPHGMPQGGPPPGGGGGGGADKNSVAAQVAKAMQGVGKTQAHVDIPQSKVGMVIGRNGATLNAVKTYAKSDCFIEQNTPDEDKARITIVGSATGCEKCKQTVNALVDGTMSAATLFQLAGVPLPAGGAGEASASDRDRIGGGGGAMPNFPMGMPPPGGMPGFPPMGMGAGGMGGPTIHGLPENQQMQQNLNDYYARLWATYSVDHPGAGGPKHHAPAMPTGPAFDKDALLKLAARASEPQPEMPPMPPDHYNQREPAMPHRGVPISTLPMLSDPGFSAMPPHPDDARMQALYASVAPPRDDRAYMPDAYDPEAGVGGSSGPAVSSTARGGPAGGAFKIGMKMMPAEPQKAKKDEDSVHKMMERLQGNVEQNKQAKKDGEEAPAVGPVRMQLGQVRRGNQASLSQMLEGQNGAALPFGEQNFRTQSDVDFDALLARMPAAVAPEDIENLGREVLIRFPRFAPHQITELLQKIDSNPGLQNGDFQAELSRVLIPRLKEFNSSQFTTLTSTFASWSNDARGNKKKGRFSEFSKAFFLAASAEMTSRLMEYAPHEINCCLAAFVSVGFSEHKFFASVGRAALARHSSFAPVQLTALLAILSEMRLVHVDLFNASAQFLSMRAKELRPVDVIRVLRSFSKCSVHHHGMCRAIGDEVVSRIRTKSSNFKVEDLCEIAYSFCVLSYYHEDMFRVLFKELEKSPMISTDALIQLYECHLTLDCEHKDEYASYRMDRDLAHALQEHYREHRKDERRCSERQRNDVASVLKSLVDGSVHVNHRTSTGLLVDVAALRKRSSTDGFIHVDLDSTVTVVRSLDQEEQSPASIITEGPVALRRRILAKHGLRLVTVRESEWRELDDSKDKRRHLRSLLSSLGDVLE